MYSTSYLHTYYHKLLELNTFKTIGKGLVFYICKLKYTILEKKHIMLCRFNYLSEQLLFLLVISQAINIHASSKRFQLIILFSSIGVLVFFS